MLLETTTLGGKLKQSQETKDCWGRGPSCTGLFGSSSIWLETFMKPVVYLVQLLPHEGPFLVAEASDAPAVVETGSEVADVRNIPGSQFYPHGYTFNLILNPGDAPHSHSRVRRLFLAGFAALPSYPG